MSVAIFCCSHLLSNRDCYRAIPRFHVFVTISIESNSLLRFTLAKDIVVELA